MLQNFMMFKAKSKMLSKRFTQMANNNIKKGGSALSDEKARQEVAQTQYSDDEDTFDLKRLQKEKQFAHLKELKVTFDYNGKIVPVKDPALNQKIVNPEVSIEQ